MKDTIRRQLPFNVKGLMASTKRLDEKIRSGNLRKDFFGDK